MEINFSATCMLSSWPIGITRHDLSNQQRYEAERKAVTTKKGSSRAIAGTVDEDVGAAGGRRSGRGAKEPVEAECKAAQ